MNNIEPFYKNMGITLYNNDVKDVVNIIDDNSIDLMLTDPPYGINYVSGHRKEKMKEIQNDDVLYMDIDMFWNKIKDTGSLWSFYSHKIELNDTKHSDRNYQLMEDCLYNIQEGLSSDMTKLQVMAKIKTIFEEIEQHDKTPHLTRIKNRIIWVKNNWSAGDLEGDFGNQYECIAFMPKEKFKLKGYRYSNVWDFRRVPPSNHPTEKPAELISRIIESCTNIGDLVYDPFVGSGTTLFVCKRLGRRFVGSEIDSGHCQNIVNDDRLKQMGLGI